DLIYDGDFASGPTYKDGEIVVYNGVAYMCTMPTTNAPTAWPGSPGSVATYPTPAYGTSLPASPADGQQAILVDSVTNPTYQWLFRYNAQSTSAYKWEFIGGADWFTSDENDVTTTSVYPTMAQVGTLGVFIVPRAGEYIVTWATNYYNSTAAIYGYHA